MTKLILSAVIGIISGYFWYQSGEALWAFSCGASISGLLGQCQIAIIQFQHALEETEKAEKLKDATARLERTLRQGINRAQ